MTPSQIALFLRQATEQEDRDYKRNLAISWLGNNLSKEGIQKELGTDSKSFKGKKSRKTANPKKVKDDWKRLMTDLKSLH